MLQQACCQVSSGIGVGKVYSVHVHILFLAFVSTYTGMCTAGHCLTEPLQQARWRAGGAVPPVAAQKVSQSKVEWGGVRSDSYAWLQDKTASNPEVLSYLEQVQHTHCNTSFNFVFSCCSVLKGHHSHCYIWGCTP